MYDTIERLMNNARLKLPGAIDGAILNELFNVVDMFCRRADANRYPVEVAIQAGVTTYEITFAGEVVVRVFEITHEIMDVSKTYYDADSNMLALGVTPTALDATYPIYLNMSMAPKPDATDPDTWMPELTWQRYYGVLLDGTLSAMHGQPAKPYYNKELASFYGRRFRTGINIAKQQVAVGQAPNASSWRFPSFTGSRYGQS